MEARVLIPVDNQECTVSALKSVMSRGWDKDTKFLLLKVVEDFSELLYANELGHSEALSIEQEQYTYEMRMWLNELTDSFSKVFPDTQSRMEFGRVSQRICEIAYEWCADYIAIGSHDRHLSYRCALGSIAAEVLSSAPCSVEAIRYKDLHRLLMQEGKITDDDIQAIVCPPSRIMVAVDLSHVSEVVIDWVGSIGWTEGANLRLVTVDNPQHRDEKSHWNRGIGTLYTREGQRHKIVESKLRDLETRLEAICKIPHDSTIIRHETPATAIIQAASEWNADFVVIGASSERSQYGTKVGSTPLEIIADLHCSLAIIQADSELRPTFSWRRK